MASFFNLTLDTLAPSGLSLLIDNGATYATKQGVTLTIGISDADTTGYQMKIWGIDGVVSESAASWETFTTTKAVNLTEGDGTKTVYIKVRDDVGNETASVSDSIVLNTAVPVVSIIGPDKTKISKVTGYDASKFTFTADVKIISYKVCVVPQSTALQASGTVIPTENGSVNTSGEGEWDADEAVAVTINGADLEVASGGDGIKIIKVFVQNEAGTWSVA